MGTRLVVTIDASSRAEALRAADDALNAVECVERLLSTWDSASVLGRLNVGPLGEVRSPPDDVARLLATAERWARRTGRAFEPSIGALIDAWDLRGKGRRPGEEELADALAATGPRGILIDPASGAVTRLTEAAWIDTGAFGKGAALLAARAALQSAGARSAMVDLGGQVLALGSPPAATDGWPVGIAHPVHRDRPVAWLRLRSVSVATSGASERGIVVDGERLGHILDPRSGHPVPAWGSVTVVSADPVKADVLATALFVLGPDAALSWARDQPALAVLVLEHTDEGLHAHWTPSMERWLEKAPGAPHPTNPIERILP